MTCSLVVHHVIENRIRPDKSCQSLCDDSRTPPGTASSGDMQDEYIFYQRTQLLAVMAEALAEGRLEGQFRKKALQDNLNRICETLIFNFHIKDVNFLKVA